MTARGWHLVLAGSLGIMSLGVGGLLATQQPAVPAEPGVGRLLIKSAPSGCMILVDGVVQEGVVTHALLEASEGERTVRVHCEGHPSLVKEVTVASGKTTKVFFDLDGN